jgi:hypothetical protein
MFLAGDNPQSVPGTTLHRRLFAQSTSMINEFIPTPKIAVGWGNGVGPAKFQERGDSPFALRNTN